MRRVLWFAAWFAVAVWSLFALTAYNLLDFAGAVAMRNADWFSSDPETVEWIWRSFSWIRSGSTSVALVVWGVVCLVILSVPWTLDRLIGRPPSAPRAAPPSPSGVIDLTPDQYTVRTGSSDRGPAGPVPRILPRR